mgnify:FL=1
MAKKSGAWYTYGEERLGQGREAAKGTLEKNPDLRNEIEYKVREEYDIPQQPGATAPANKASDAADKKAAAASKKTAEKK